MNPILRETAAYRTIRNRLDILSQRPDTFLDVDQFMGVIEQIADDAISLREHQEQRSTPPGYRFHLYTTDDSIERVELAGSYRTFQEACLWVAYMQGHHQTLLLLDTNSYSLTTVLKNNILHQTVSEVIVSHLTELAGGSQ